MTNTEMRQTVAAMLQNWNAMTPAQQLRASLIANITASEIELQHRLRAASHLTGVPQLHNASAINKLYDALTALNIELLEHDATK